MAATRQVTATLTLPLGVAQEDLDAALEQMRLWLATRLRDKANLDPHADPEAVDADKLRLVVPRSAVPRHQAPYLFPTDALQDPLRAQPKPKKKGSHDGQPKRAKTAAKGSAAAGRGDAGRSGAPATRGRKPSGRSPVGGEATKGAKRGR